MIVPGDPALLAYLAGALDPGATKQLEEELTASLALRQRLAALRARLDRIDRQARGWDLPPPGVSSGQRPFAAQLELRLVMDGGPLRPGDRFSVLLEPVEDAADRFLVVLLRRDGRWEPVFPTCAEERTPVTALPLLDDGRRRLDLIAQEPPGRQRWAVAQAPADLPIAWDADPDTCWAALREGIADGSIPVVGLEIEVG